MKEQKGGPEIIPNTEIRFNAYGEQFELGQKAWTRKVYGVLASGTYIRQKYGQSPVIEKTPYEVKVRHASQGWTCPTCGKKIYEGDMHGSTFYDHYCLDCITPFKPETEVEFEWQKPIKGEQAGMLGVPGKYVEQKRSWTPGQIEIESYTKYKKAMESPEELDRKLREFERKTLKEEQVEEAKELEKILSGMMGKKKKPKVEAEVMKHAEKPSKNLYWYSIAELKKMCQTKGLSIEGSKENLIRRLK